MEALELEPLNSMVLAAVANTRLVLDKDVSACMELARRSVSLNPSNPLAWNSLATAKLYAGDIGEAHALAVRAQSMSSGSPFGHWWDFGRCLTAALTGRLDEAHRAGERLRKLEDGFSFERMAKDESYPISPHRWSGLLDAERLMDLEDR